MLSKLIDRFKIYRDKHELRTSTHTGTNISIMNGRTRCGNNEG